MSQTRPCIIAARLSEHGASLTNRQGKLGDHKEIGTRCRVACSGSSLSGLGGLMKLESWKPCLCHVAATNLINRQETCKSRRSKTILSIISGLRVDALSEHKLTEEGAWRLSAYHWFSMRHVSSEASMGVASLGQSPESLVL